MAKSLHLIAKERAALKELGKQRQAMTQRFPLIFTLVGAFGLVATFYGFEGLIDRVPYFYDNPIILLVVGLGLLIITGSLYRKLR